MRRAWVGGHDVRAFPQADLRELMAVVPQDVYLFHTTIRENIRLGRPGASDEEVEAAAELAQAAPFIRTLPDGWETVAGERAATLSGGQRQRIAIGRALLRDALLAAGGTLARLLDRSADGML